jgi:hypothetical protein
MTRIAQSYWQAELSRAAEGIIPSNLLYELYPWFRISINMFSVKEGCAGKVIIPLGFAFLLVQLF